MRLRTIDTASGADDKDYGRANGSLATSRGMAPSPKGQDDFYTC